MERAFTPLAEAESEEDAEHTLEFSWASIERQHALSESFASHSLLEQTEMISRGDPSSSCDPHDCLCDEGFATSLVNIGKLLDPRNGHRREAQDVALHAGLAEVVVHSLAVAASARMPVCWLLQITSDATRGHSPNAVAFVRAGVVAQVCALLSKWSANSQVQRSCLCALINLANARETPSDCALERDASDYLSGCVQRALVGCRDYLLVHLLQHLLRSLDTGDAN